MERRVLERSSLGASAAVELANSCLVPVEVADISAGGVRITIPPEVEGQDIVAILLRGRRYLSSVIWNADRQLGLAFSEPVSSDPVLQAVAEVMSSLSNRT